MDKNIYLPLTMLICGIIGGVTDQAVESIQNNGTIKKGIFGKIMLGVVAAFLVPLFLNTISSNLVEKVGSDIQSFYVFIGFCLLASLSPMVFIKTLSDKAIAALQNGQKDINKQVKQISGTVESIVVKNVEIPIEPNDDLDVSDTNIIKKGNLINLTDDPSESKILLELGRNSKTFLYVNTLAEAAGLARGAAIKKLQRMKDKNIITTTNIGRSTGLLPLLWTISNVC